jgi:biotin carboxylase
LEAVVNNFIFECRSLDASGDDLLIIVGSGEQKYREYALSAAASKSKVALVAMTAPSWELPYLADYRLVNDTEVDTLSTAIRDLAASHAGNAGVMTWSEMLLEDTARAAHVLGMRHMSPAAAATCRDKLAARQRQSIGAAKYAHVGTLRDAKEALNYVGLPAIIKPRSLAGSVGVVRVNTVDELEQHFGTTAASHFPGLASLSGSILEEYLDGPEISVDSVVWNGDANPVNVARKRLGFEPYCQEVGHLVMPWLHEPWAEDLITMLKQVHRDLGVEVGVTHAEVRLTESGPRLVELNGRLGGDFIPYLGFLATGVDLTAAAASVALGHEPDLSRTADTCAEIRFLFPTEDGVVEEIDVAAAAAVDGIVEIVTMVSPPAALRLPPRGLEPRIVALIAAGEKPEDCSAILDAAEALIRVRLTPEIEISG